MTTPDTLPATQSGMTEVERGELIERCGERFGGMILREIDALQARISEVEKERDQAQTGFKDALELVSQCDENNRALTARVAEVENKNDEYARDVVLSRARLGEATARTEAAEARVAEQRVALADARGAIAWAIKKFEAQGYDGIAKYRTTLEHVEAALSAKDQP